MSAARSSAGRYERTLRTLAAAPTACGPAESVSARAKYCTCVVSHTFHARKVFSSEPSRMCARKITFTESRSAVSAAASTAT